MDPNSCFPSNPAPARQLSGDSILALGAGVFDFRRKQVAEPERLRTPVIYTMGKTGSTSIAEAIRVASRPVYHIHSLRPDYLVSIARPFLDRGEFPVRWMCEAMGWRTRLLLLKDQCFYITLVREPIARRISGFFQNLRMFAGPDAVSKPVEELLEIFLANYSNDYDQRWFEDEFRGQLGIDVYSEPFDRKARYLQMRKAPVLILRSDCPTDKMSRVISTALGFDVRIGRENDSSMKNYAQLYAAFKTAARFSAAFLDNAYDNAYARHFWSEEEILSFRSTWAKAADRSLIPA